MFSYYYPVCTHLSLSLSLSSSHACYMSCPSHPPWQVMKLLLIIKVAPASCYFTPLGSRYSPHTLLSSALILCSFLNIRDQVLHPYETTDTIIRAILGEEYRLWSLSLCHLLHSAVVLFLFGPCILVCASVRHKVLGIGWVPEKPLASPEGLLARLTLKPWRWKWHVPPKRRLTYSGLHGIIS
jgi:hypothetical protein